MAQTDFTIITDNEEEKRTFLLLRYVLIASAAYVFLFEGEGEPPALSVIFVAGALLSNVFLSRLSQKLFSQPLTVGIILCLDIGWISAGLWSRDGVGSDVFILYFFILFLAATVQNIILIVAASVLLTLVDLTVFVIPVAEGKSIWASASLIRMPFMFTAGLFYGYLSQRVRGAQQRAAAERQIAEKRIHALHELNVAITSTLELQRVLDILLEKIDIVLPHSAARVRLFNKDSGMLEVAASRNFEETEWKQNWKGGPGPADQVYAAKTPLAIPDVQTDPRIADPDFFRRQGLVSYLGIPLAAKDETLGVLSFCTKEKHQFGSDEVEFLQTLAGEAAVAISNSQLYERVKNLADELAASNRVKDEFLSIMSHELRTPISLIMGYTAMLTDGAFGETNPDQKSTLAKLANFSQDLLTMVNSMLYMTAVETQLVKAEKRVAFLGDLLDQLRSSYELRLSKELILHWDYDSNLPHLTTDSDKLKMILQNLINNAIKFTEKGDVTISARYIPEANAVKFTVADTGIGIPRESLPLIFERFQQLDSSHSRSYEGIGLGLHVVKRFTEILGGTVEVKSEPGRGSKFTVTLGVEPPIHGLSPM
jgi:signal transduction histidine kinase